MLSFNKPVEYTSISHEYSIFYLSELMNIELRIEINTKLTKFDPDYPEFLSNARTGGWK